MTRSRRNFSRTENAAGPRGPKTPRTHAKATRDRGRNASFPAAGVAGVVVAAALFLASADCSRSTPRAERPSKDTQVDAPTGRASGSGTRTPGAPKSEPTPGATTTSGGNESPGAASSGSFTLGLGETRRCTFRAAADGPVVLWVQVRSELTDAADDGTYAMRLRLDGRPLDATVLNKDEVVYVPPETRGNRRTKKDAPPSRRMPLRDSRTGAWLVTNASSFYIDDPQNHWPTWPFAGRAWFSNHFEYAFLVEHPGAGSHTLEVTADASAGAKLHVREVKAVQPAGGNLVSSVDLMEIVFPWQTPQPDTLVDGEVNIRACAGEYEPFTLSVFALSGLEGVSVSLDALKAEGGATIPGGNVTAFAVEPLARKALGEAAFIDKMPFIPERWKRHSPELLVPLSERKARIPARESRRFYIDIRVPEGQAPGRYTGTARVASAGKHVANVPVTLEVLPFGLAPARSKYWMWRLTWSAISEPQNIACLRDIREHGFTGLTRMCGAGWRFSVDGSGRVTADDSSIRDFADALSKTGLAPRISDDHVAGKLIKAVVKHVGLDVDVSKELPDLKTFFLKKADPIDVTDAAGEKGGDATRLELDPSGPASESAAKEAEAARLAAHWYGKINPLVVQGFREVKRICDEIGLGLWVFVVDEPCGTPWRRRWTRYAAGLAKEAGLTTWGTRNNYTWDANIDYGAPGIRSVQAYADPELVEHAFEGVPTFAPLPWIGAFRGGENYHFEGLIDEVRVYNRALTKSEIVAQHERPAEGALLAYYSFDGDDPVTARDASPAGNHAKITGGARRADGKHGRAIELNGKDQHVEPPDPKGRVDMNRGWSISLWYKGTGCKFGRGYEFYQQGGSKLRYSTTREDKAWAKYRGMSDTRFWTHLTVSFDTAARVIRFYAHDVDTRAWYRENIEWNYNQIRSMPPHYPRGKTGVMAWREASHGALTNITTFCYDWNANHLYVAYPKNGDRWNDEGIWYRTIGWEATREGIDDARYLHTLERAYRTRFGLNEAEAVARVDAFLARVDKGYGALHGVADAFGGYAQMRGRIIDEILSTMGK